MKILYPFILLTLLASNCFAQSYSPMYTPSSSHNLSFQCIDIYDRPIPGAHFTVTPGVYHQTNAHLHDSSSHPFSSASPGSGYADSNGVFSFTLVDTLIGQAEFISITCSNQAGQVTGQFNYAVGYNDVYYNDHPDIWIKIGGDDTGGGTGHGTTAYNRYMTSSAAYGLYNATYTYFGTHPGVSQLCTNDMTLPFGGKFDISDTWASPHISHDRGTAGDVAGPGSSQCPASNQVVISDFIAACVANGANATHSIPEGNHAHCNWADPSTYPH
ncbi:MAG TPA: hypothetical protein VHW24_27275 [Bryobacteraceae bacterium]|jgi:hypothetical protein|nr:hypothetical protein [Bryobacteraceae bacterium]